MKRTIVILAVMLLLSTAAAAAVGPVEGKQFEFSTGFALSIQNYNYSYGAKETYTYFMIPFRLGIFIWKGLEFEPELMLTAEHYKYTEPGYSDTGHSTGYILSGNLLYNFKLNGSPRMIPFVLAGFGFGNGDLEGTDVDNYYPIGSPKTTLLNLGVGVKYMFGNIAALRFEYRFRGGRIKYTEDLTEYTDKVNFHTFLLGLSLFF
jgi:opacity protein-like surface antigen